MDSRFDSIQTTERATQIVQLCLRIGVAIQCFGIAGRYLLSRNETESDVYELWFFDWDGSEVVAQWIDDTGAYVCLAAVVFLVVYGTISWFLKPSQTSFVVRAVAGIEIALLGSVFLWTLALAAAHSVRGALYAELTIGEHALRIALPLVLILSLGKAGSSFKTSLGNPARKRGDTKRGNFASLSRRFSSFGKTSRLFFRSNMTFVTWTLKFAVATTFLMHGYKAIELYGPFVDLILLTDAHWVGLELDQATAEYWLTMIGWVDIGMACLLVCTRWKWVALYMFIWGLVTALSRMTAFGFLAWPETTIRTANWAGPLILFLIYSSSFPGNFTEQTDSSGV